MPSTTAAIAASAPHEDHETLPQIERLRRVVRALRSIHADPQRTEQILEFLNLINSMRSTQARLKRFHFDAVAARALYAEKLAIDSRSVNVDALAALPEGTLGHAYASFLRSHGLTLEIFEGMPSGVSDPQLAYFVQRMRQTHDLWHVVTGCETDPAGETALQAFTFAVVGAPGSAVLALVGMLRTMRGNPGVVRDVVRMYRTGVRARKVPMFRWEDHWQTPLSEVRTKLGLPAEPHVRAAA